VNLGIRKPELRGWSLRLLMKCTSLMPPKSKHADMILLYSWDEKAYK